MIRRATLPVLAVAALAAGGCGGGYSARIKANFLNACEATSGGAAHSCECVLHYAEAHASEGQLRAAEARIREGGEYPPWMNDAASTCR